MSTHLYRRQGGTYYFRRIIPASRRSAFDGKREWIVSLRIKDREQAKRSLPAMVATFDAAMLTVYPSSGAIPDRTPETHPTASQPVGSTHVAKTTKRPSLALLSAFDSYAREQGIKPTTSVEWRAVIQGLIAFLGHDDLTRVTSDDLIRWRDHLLQGITKRGSQRDPRTVRNGYFTPLKATLNWALQNQLIVTNPAEKLTIRVPRKAALRERNFDHSEIRKILSATLAPPSLRISEGARLARRWIPWLCAYTGARVNEMSQLRSKDIQYTEGIWNIRITPEAGTVKSNVARIVPLHPHLIEQGFIALKIDNSEAPLFYDPRRSIRMGIGNRHFKKVGERLRDWVRDEIGITDSSIQPNHAWRHTFKTRCIDAGIPERIADAIQGHAPRSVGQSYGSVSLEAKAKAIASLPRFEIASPG